MPTRPVPPPGRVPSWWSDRPQQGSVPGRLSGVPAQARRCQPERPGRLPPVQARVKGRRAIRAGRSGAWPARLPPSRAQPPRLPAASGQGLPLSRQIPHGQAPVSQFSVIISLPDRQPGSRNPRMRRTDQDFSPGPATLLRTPGRRSLIDGRHGVSQEGSVVMVGGRRVIAGVSGSLRSLGALRAGEAEARSRGAALLAVLAWAPAGGEVAYMRAPCPLLLRLWEQAARERLQESFDAVYGGMPTDVTVRTMVVRARPGPLLVELADRPDDLLVVGYGGRGRARRHALGSVG